MEIAPGIQYDNGLPIWEQTPEAQAIIYQAAQGIPLSQEKERTDGGNARLAWQEFALNSYVLKISYNYNTPPDSNEWAGLKTKEYTVYAK